MPFKFTFTLAALLLATPAMAGSFVDTASGFAVTVPDDFTIEDMGMRNGVLVAMNSAELAEDGEGRFQCAVSIMRAPHASDLAQAEISAAMASPERQAFLAQEIGAQYHIDTQMSFTNAGVGGTEFLTRPKDVVDGDPYLYLAMIESAPGRTILSCTAFDEDIAAALPIYRQIRDSMIAPTR